MQKSHSHEWKVLQKLKMENEDRVSVKINPVCIFLFRDGEAFTDELMYLRAYDLPSRNGHLYLSRFVSSVTGTITL